MSAPALGPISVELERQLELVERDAVADMYDACPRDVGLGCKSFAMDGNTLLLCREVDHIQLNRVIAPGLAESPRAESLDRIVTTFAAAGVKNWIIHVAPRSTGLAELCDARGFVPHSRTWAKFVRGAEPIASHTELDVREVGPEHARAFGEVVAEGFGMSALCPWLGAIVGRPRWRCFLAFDGTTPVASGAVYIDRSNAWIGMGATLSAYRGRGAQGALLAARINLAVREGCTLLTTETGVPHDGERGPSFKNIQRSGFRIAYERPNLWRPPALAETR